MNPTKPPPKKGDAAPEDGTFVRESIGPHDAADRAAHRARERLERVAEEQKAAADVDTSFGGSGTVHVKQFDGDFALCCDGSVRALVDIRHEWGQVVRRDLVSTAGTCGCKK